MNKQKKPTKNKPFSKVILFSSIVFVLLIIGAVAGLSAWRNSEAEIGDLCVSEKVNSNNKPVNSTSTIPANAENIYISGRLAHVQESRLRVEFIDIETNNDQKGYPKTIDVKVSLYPDNYFAFKLDENSCKPCSGIGWRTGSYKVKVYPEDDKNFIRPEVNFKIVK